MQTPSYKIEARCASSKQLALEQGVLPHSDCNNLALGSTTNVCHSDGLSTKVFTVRNSEVSRTEPLYTHPPLTFPNPCTPHPPVHPTCPQPPAPPPPKHQKHTQARNASNPPSCSFTSGPAPWFFALFRGARRRSGVRPRFGVLVWTVSL